MSVLRIKKSNNYVVLHKGALENPNLSFKAKGLWAYCMSRPDNWTFHVSHLATVSKDGEDAIYSAIKELEKERYIRKVQPNVRGRFQTTDYEVYEIPQDPELKECLPQTDFPDAVVSHADKPALLINDSNKELKDTNKKSASPPPSADAEILFDFFLGKIKERNPGFRDPDKKKWLLEFDRLLRVDKRTLDEVKKLVEWASSHSFWGANCLSPSSLRKHYDKMFMQMGAATDSQRIENNRTFVLYMKKKYPDQLKGLTISPKYAENLAAGKEVPFSLPEEIFKQAFMSMFGGRYEPTRQP